jgi:tellurite resistance protein TehA-like permease
MAWLHSQIRSVVRVIDTPNHLLINNNKYALNRWFAIVMGTGIISILLYKLPYNGAWIYWISVAIFVINITLFAIFSLTSALRYICYPILWRAMITHPVESLFVATFPMSVGIIAQGIVNICVPAWGPWAASLAWVLWWIEAVTSVAICFYIPFNM